MRPKRKRGQQCPEFGRTMRKMFRVNVSFPSYKLSLHVKKLSKQLDRVLGTDIYGFHERNHKGHQELPWFEVVQLGLGGTNE